MRGTSTVAFAVLCGATLSRVLMCVQGHALCETASASAATTDCVRLMLECMRHVHRKRNIRLLVGENPRGRVKCACSV